MGLHPGRARLRFAPDPAHVRGPFRDTSFDDESGILGPCGADRDAIIPCAARGDDYAIGRPAAMAVTQGAGDFVPGGVGPGGQFPARRGIFAGSLGMDRMMR